jgi:L-amino acid N-acyltransferase YncA
MSARIRLAEESDAAAIASIYKPIVEETIISFEVTAPGRDEMAERIRQTLLSYPFVVCDVDGTVAGYAYASRHRARAGYQWSIDTSVYTGEPYRRCGVGRALYESLFRILGAQRFVNAYAGIALPNPGSVGFHESLGFELVGVYRHVGFKLGAWHDTAWFQRALNDCDASPQAPLQLPVVQARQDWPELLAHGERAIRMMAPNSERPR